MVSWLVVDDMACSREGVPVGGDEVEDDGGVVTDSDCKFDIDGEADGIGVGVVDDDGSDDFGSEGASESRLLVKLRSRSFLVRSCLNSM